MTGSYNNFFRMFDRNTKRDVTLEASRENSKPRAILKPRKVGRMRSKIKIKKAKYRFKLIQRGWETQS